MAHRILLIIGVMGFFALQPISVFGVTVDMALSMEVCPAGGCVEPEPEPEPSPAPEEASPGVPGFFPIEPIIDRGTEDEIFVNPEDGFSPYVKIGMIGSKAVIGDDPIWIYNREPKIQGVTNLKNAMIFLEYVNYPETVYTAFADYRGLWEILSPLNLPVGWHTIRVKAVSPVNAGVSAQTELEFEIRPIPPPDAPAIEMPKDGAIDEGDDSLEPPEEEFFDGDESQEDAPFGEEETGKDIPPVSDDESIMEEDTGYGIDSRVSEDSKSVFPSEKVRVITKVRPLLSPDERWVVVEYLVKDESGKVVFRESEEVRIEGDEKEIEKTFPTSIFSRPGEYTVETRIRSHERYYASLDTFIVAETEYFSVFGVFENLLLWFLAAAVLLLGVFSFLFWILGIKKDRDFQAAAMRDGGRWDENEGG